MSSTNIRMKGGLVSWVKLRTIAASSTSTGTTELLFMSKMVKNEKERKVLRSEVAREVSLLISFKSCSPREMTTTGSSSDRVCVYSGSRPGLSCLCSTVSPVPFRRLCRVISSTAKLLVSTVSSNVSTSSPVLRSRSKESRNGLLRSG